MLSVLRTKPHSILREEAESFFIGFSWGPTADAFLDVPATPATLEPALSYRASAFQTPLATASQFATPIRGVGIGAIPFASTLRRTRTAPRRAVSDREAMRQLVDCIGLSARKKVIAAGRTPRRDVLGSTAKSKTKTLRFATHHAPEPLDFAHAHAGEATGTSLGWGGDSADSVDSSILSALDVANGDESDCASESDAPPSPSPSPRPGSALSMLSRRSVTPTTTNSGLLRRSLLMEATPGAATTTQRSEAVMPIRTSPSPPPPVYPDTADDGDKLVALEERHRMLMGEIASIEGRMGAVKRWTY